MVKKTSSPNVVIEVLDDHVNDVIKALAAEARNALVDATPVDTGFAQANWRVNLTKPAAGTLGQKEKRAAKAAAALTESQSERAVVMFDHKKHKQIVISNNVNYIGMVGADGKPGLNAGSSPKARPFFIQTAVYKTIAKVRRSFKGVIRRIK
jgi:hypothetical protein